MSAIAVRAVSADVTLGGRIGEPFNPWRGECGFYPPDFVRRMPGYVGGRRAITDGQKLLYERLVRYAGKDGHCYPTHATLAGELGKTDRQICADLKKLEQLGFIRHQNRVGRRSNTYVFLWHPVFENSKMEPSRDEPPYDLSGSTLPVKSEAEPLIALVERKHTSGQMQKAPVSTPVLSGSTLPVNGAPQEFERKCSVNLSGSTLPPNSVQRNNTHTHSPVFGERKASAWPCGGWETAEDFENWFAQLVQVHPNRSRNGIAKTKAIELVLSGKLTRAEFDEGYATLREANALRWTEQHGRFAPNLWQLLDDQAWKYSPPAQEDEAPDEYRSAEGYLPEHALPEKFQPEEAIR